MQKPWLIRKSKGKQDKTMNLAFWCQILAIAVPEGGSFKADGQYNKNYLN